LLKTESAEIKEKLKTVTVSGDGAVVKEQKITPQILKD
jgi:hypothetical protein